MRKLSRRLPLVEEDQQPLLTGPDEVQERPVESVTREASETADWQEQASGLQVEADGSHKQPNRRLEYQIRQERQRLLHRLLTVADNLERALAYSAENDGLREGVQLSLDDLLWHLAQEGVEPIDALGQPFDPHVHEAVATDGTGGSLVAEVLQTGYTLDNELLRPTRVIVGRPAA